MGREKARPIQCEFCRNDQVEYIFPVNQFEVRLPVVNRQGEGFNLIWRSTQGFATCWICSQYIKTESRQLLLDRAVQSQLPNQIIRVQGIDLTPDIIEEVLAKQIDVFFENLKPGTPFRFG